MKRAALSDVKNMFIEQNERVSKKTQQVELKLTDMFTKSNFAEFLDSNKKKFAACDSTIATLATKVELKQTNDKVVDFFEHKLNDYSEKLKCMRQFELQGEKNYSIGV